MHLKADLTSTTKTENFWQANDYTFYCLLFGFFNLVEFGVMFSGLTLFNNNINIVIILLHITGIISTIRF